MTRNDMAAASEAFIRATLRKRLPADTRVYLYGSRARQSERWNSDYDLWVDADVSDRVVADILDELDESFVPFKVDIVTTSGLRGRFGDIVRSEAVSWM